MRTSYTPKPPAYADIEKGVVARPRRSSAMFVFEPRRHMKIAREDDGRGGRDRMRRVIEDVFRQLRDVGSVDVEARITGLNERTVRKSLPRRKFDPNRFDIANVIRAPALRSTRPEPVDHVMVLSAEDGRAGRPAF